MIHRGRLAIVVLSLIGLIAVRGSAQRLDTERAGFSNRMVVASSRAGQAATSSIPATHWKEGALIGGIVGAAVGVFGYELVVHVSDTPTSGAALPAMMAFGALVFGLIGAMIGSFSRTQGS